jgi:hypothetical protein
LPNWQTSILQSLEFYNTPNSSCGVAKLRLCSEE